MGIQELQHDCLSIAGNRKELIISCLLIWLSPTQSLEAEEKNLSPGTPHFLCISCLLEGDFCSFS